jgi:hypothetical protein
MLVCVTSLSVDAGDLFRRHNSEGLREEEIEVDNALHGRSEG